MELVLTRKLKFISEDIFVKHINSSKNENLNVWFKERPVGSEYVKVAKEDY